MTPRIKTRFLLALTATLVIGACTGGDGSGSSSSSTAGIKPASTEDLLAAEGSWNLVEEEQMSSPIQEHMSARGQVDPDKPAGTAQYTSKPGPEGVKEDVHFRVLRLEREVADLKHDFKKLLPPLAGLIASDRKLDDTIAEIESDDSMASNVAVPSAKPKPPMQRHSAPKPVSVTAKAPEEKTPKPAPVTTSGPLAVTDVRSGIHPGKTRLVLDLNAAGKFSYDLDNAEKLLLVELPGASWKAQPSRSFGNNPVIKSYTAQPSNGGTRLAIELKKPAKILASSALSPNAVHGHRIYLDIAAQ